MNRLKLIMGALGELKRAAGLIPNETILIGTLPMLEALYSSKIENIVTTSDKLFQFRALEEHADPATKEALRYSHALSEGYKALIRCPLNTGTAERVCGTIKGVEMQVRRVPGTALANEHTGEIIYTPPIWRGFVANFTGQLGKLSARPQGS
jgi:hypothetical protein